ncbi:MAG: 16S rRNA (adenine(1518)-N(6)/adenine(1519)-N(6))-dimethyltransferase RsmA, partial [Lactobacillus iners]|nr:16S rRNA (adenine(1518)-N(6)/adenine(1519)-N(6))-dimethyltransferase RsmA [Lactobacillus iners]
MSNSIPIATPLRTRAIVNRYFMKAKKSLGQNFLVDLPIVKKIVASAGVFEGSQVIEIGPGIGSLTEQLLLAGAKVLAYEVDPDLPDILYNELPAQIGN